MIYLDDFLKNLFFYCTVESPLVQEERLFLQGLIESWDDFDTNGGSWDLWLEYCFDSVENGNENFEHFKEKLMSGEYDPNLKES